MSHRRSQPDGEIVQLLGTEARNAAEHLGDVVLTIPFWQVLEKHLNRIVLRHLLRLHILRNLCLRTAFLQYVLALGTNHDTVQGRLRQRTVIQISLIIGGARETVEGFDSIAFGLVVSLWQNRELHLSIQDVPTETVVRHEELLDHKRSSLRGSWSLCRQKKIFLHLYLNIKSLIHFLQAISFSSNRRAFHSVLFKVQSYKKILRSANFFFKKARIISNVKMNLNVE